MVEMFNIIKNEAKYWLVDQVDQKGIRKKEYKEKMEQIFADWKKESVGYLSLLMKEDYHDWLLEKGLIQVSSTVEYTRELGDLPKINEGIQWHSLSEGLITGVEYGKLYIDCTKGTANKNPPQAKEQLFQSLEKELGSLWREHCFYFIGYGEMLGVAIPHIEMGTKDEGRLFYFGVTPGWRGKGIGTEIHKIALRLLRQLGAISYVGSTDSSNMHMIQIFQQNGCVFREQKGMYRAEKDQGG